MAGGKVWGWGFLGESTIPARPTTTRGVGRLRMAAIFASVRVPWDARKASADKRYHKYLGCWGLRLISGNAVCMMGAITWSTLFMTVRNSPEGITEAWYPILIKAGKNRAKFRC